MNVGMMKLWTRAVLVAAVAVLVLSSGCGGGGSTTGTRPVDPPKPLIVGIDYDHDGVVDLKMDSTTGLSESVQGISCVPAPGKLYAFQAWLIVNSGTKPYNYQLLGSETERPRDMKMNPQTGEITYLGNCLDAVNGATDYQIGMGVVDSKGQSTVPSGQLRITIR